jgi:AraC-like DNA-binding protein
MPAPAGPAETPQAQAPSSLAVHDKDAALPDAPRDSTLDAVLAAPAHQDSALAGRPFSPYTASSAVHPPPQKTPHAVWIKRHRSAILIAAAIVGLLIAIGVILTVAHGKGEGERFMTTTRLSLMDGEVQRACLHIEKHFADPALTPKSVCAAITTGEPFLEALFARELGMSVAGYLDQVRIHHAKQIINRNPAADAQQVSSLAGFPHAAAFEKTFAAVSGVDFASFRREKSAAAG